MNDFAAQAEKAWSQYEPMVTAGAERQLADQIKAGWADYQQMTQKLIGLVESGDKKGATEFFNGDMLKHYVAGLSDPTAKDVAYNVNEGKKSADAGQATFKSARYWIIGMLVFAAAMAVFSGLMIVAAVATPIVRMTGTMGRLAQHDIAVEIPAASAGTRSARWRRRCRSSRTT